MILLDTNVISEPLRAKPEPRVTEWLDIEALETLYLSAITVAEMRYGVWALPAGARRDQLHEKIEFQILPRFANRVLSFDLPASQAYAEMMAKTRSLGRTIPISDGYIAAIAKANNMMVATRDVVPFEVAGLNTLNPWSE